MSYTDAQIRAQARSLAPELTGVSDSLLDARIEWARAHVSLRAFEAKTLTALGYLLAYAVTSDLAGSQGSTSAAIGSGATAGAITSASTGGLAIGYGGSGSVASAAPLSMSDAILAENPYGRKFLSLRQTRPKAVLPFCA